MQKDSLESMLPSVLASFSIMCVSEQYLQLGNDVFQDISVFY